MLAWTSPRALRSLFSAVVLRYRAVGEILVGATHAPMLVYWARSNTASCFEHRLPDAAMLATMLRRWCGMYWALSYHAVEGMLDGAMLTPMLYRWCGTGCPVSIVDVG